VEILKNKGETTYRESVYIDGKRVRSPTFRRKTDAKAWKADFMSKIGHSKALGIDINLQKKEKILFEHFLVDWLKQKIKVQRSQSTFRNYERIVRLHLIPQMGKLALTEILPKHADELIRYLLNRGHNQKGANLILQTLKVALYEAERQDLIRTNPLKNFKMLKVPKLPPHYWTRMEVRQFILANIDNPLFPLFVVALNTGMRKGELAGLCWDRLDFSRSMIEVSRIRDRYGLRNTTKSGVARHVPMNEMVKQTLMKLYAVRKNNFVFAREDGQALNPLHIYRDFGKAQARAKMDKRIRFHDLRHTFASHFMMSGGNLYDLQKILGHTQFEMTQIYAHLSPDHLANKTQILSFGSEVLDSLPRVPLID